MSKIKVTFVETNCKKNGPIKQTLNIIRNMDKEAFEPSLVTVWPEDADNSMIDEYKKLGISVLSANMSKKKSVLFGKKAVGQLLEQLQPDIVQGVGMPPYRMTLGYKSNPLCHAQKLLLRGLSRLLWENSRNGYGLS